MAIQKLLPAHIPSGEYYNAASSLSYSATFSNSVRTLTAPDGYGFIGYSGEEFGLAVSQEANTNLLSPVNFLRKSLSAPDDSTYIGLGVLSGTNPDISGHFTSNIGSQIAFRIQLPLDVSSITIDGITPRFRYSGIPLIDGDTYWQDDILCRFYAYDTNDNDVFPYIPLGLHPNPTFSYTGDSRSSFVDVSMGQMSLSALSGQSFVDNLLFSGAYLFFTLDFPLSGYYSGFNHYPIYLDKNMAFSAFEFEASGRIPSNYVNFHTYSAPVAVSGDFTLNTKAVGFIDSIERSTYSGVQKALPRPGTYAGGSGQLVYFNPTDYLTYRIATCYSGATSELVGSPGEISDYIRESTDSPENISYIGLTQYVTSLTGHSNTLNLAMGMRLDNLSGEPVSLKTNMTYSGVPNLLSPNFANVKSQYFLTLDNTAYEIGYASEPVAQLVNYMAYSFTKFSFPELFFDGREQPNTGNRVFVSGALLRNLIGSGAEFSTYTTAQVTSNYVFGYKNHGISAFDVEASGLVVNTETPHPQLYMYGSYPEKSVDMFMSSKSGIDNNLTLYTSGNNQIVSGLTFAMPSPSFGINDLSFYTQGDYLTSLNMYIENGTFRNNSGNFTLTTFNDYTSGELTKNINFHTSNQSGVEDNINMFIGGDGSFSGNTNLPMFIGSFNQSGVNGFPLLIENLFGSGNYGLDLYTVNTVNSSGDLNLYINGDGRALSSSDINIYINQYPNIFMSGIDIYISNRFSTNSGNIDFITGNRIEDSGDLNLYILGGKYGSDSGNVNIFIPSYEPSGTLPLHVYSELKEISKDVKLFLSSYINLSGDIPLHINGGGIDLRQGELTLVTRSTMIDSGLVNLSVVGNIATGPINLYIKTEELTGFNSQVPLSIFSAFNSGVFNSFNITTKTDGHDASLPMYMPTSSTGSDNSNIYMVMLNDTRDNKDVFLYIENNVLDNSANYTLFTQGEGTLNGGSVYSSSMNLFINRGNESVYNTIPMTLAGPSGMFESVPLVMSGGYINESGITLTMPSTTGNSKNRMDLYVNGFLY